MEFIIEDMTRIQKSETFGGRLAEAREEAERWDGKGIGYTQAELVALLLERYGVAIGRSYLSELERNWQQDRMPTLEVACGLAQALRVNLNWLAGLSNVKEAEDNDADLAWSPTTNAISNTIDRWPESARQVLLAAVRAIGPFVVVEEEETPDAGTTITDAEAQKKLYDSMSSHGLNQENGSQPQAKSKRKVRR